MMSLERLQEVLKEEQHVERDDRYNEPYFQRVVKWYGLTNIESDFYEQATGYIKSMEDDFMTNENRRERDMLEDMIRQSKMTLEGIFNRRIAKIVDLAALTADGMKGEDTVTNERNMIPLERESYENLISTLKSIRVKALSGGGGGVQQAPQVKAMCGGNIG